MAMGQQCALNRAVCLASALTLLVSVMSSPIRPDVAGKIANPTRLRRNSAIPDDLGPNGRSPLPFVSSVVRVGAVSDDCEPRLPPSDRSCRAEIGGPAAPSIVSPRAPSPAGLDGFRHALRC